MSDVCSVIYGYLPMMKSGAPDGSVKLVRDIQIFDHAVDGIQGLMTVIGVRYTLARYIAQKAINQAAQKLGGKIRPCVTTEKPLAGGIYQSQNELRKAAQAQRPPEISEAVLDMLLSLYGSEYTNLIELIKENPHWAEPIVPGKEPITAQIVHAVRAEMAVSIYDVLQRRIGLFPIAEADEQTLEKCSLIMAQELNWSEEQRHSALSEAVHSSLNLQSRYIKA
jgi:glycerol-3-phosphate dehydrogenase